MREVSGKAYSGRSAIAAVALAATVAAGMVLASERPAAAAVDQNFSTGMCSANISSNWRLFSGKQAETRNLNGRCTTIRAYLSNSSDYFVSTNAPGATFVRTPYSAGGGTTYMKGSAYDPQYGNWGSSGWIAY